MRTDLSYLQEMAGGNKMLILEMISIFKSQVAEFADEMDKLLGNKEYELLGKLAHKAKSSVAIMGMSDLAEDLKTLELLAKDKKNTRLYPTILKNFREGTSEAIEELEVVEKNVELFFNL